MAKTATYQSNCRSVEWRDVSPAHPCKKCERPDWCRYSECGQWAICRRFNDGSAEVKRDKNGDEYYVYDLTNGTATGRRYEPRFSTCAPERAVAATLDKVYRQVLALLTLDSGHAEALRRRGLNGDLAAAGYRTWPLRGRAKLARQLIDAGLEPHFPRVPGFVQKEGDGGKRYWTLRGSPGLLIPVLDDEARINAFLIRPDAQQPGKKYAYLSSKPGGPGPGSPFHVPRFSGGKALVQITEGALKADIATALSGVLTIGLPGVNATKRTARVLRKLGAATARLALDADARRNERVARALKALADDLGAKGFAVELALWDEADGKGIDDLLAGGKEPKVVAGDDAFAEIEAIAAQAEAAAGGGPDDPAPDEAKPRKSQATELVELASEIVCLHSPADEPFARFPVGDHLETWPLRSKGFRRWLAHRYFEKHHKPPAAQCVQDALGVLEGRALYDGPEMPVFARVGEHGGAYYLDLCDADWRAVKITAAG